MTQPTPAPSLRMGPTEWLLLIALSILWGGSFFFNKLTVAEWPPFAVVQVRVGLAALALLPGGAGQKADAELVLERADLA